MARYTRTDNGYVLTKYEQKPFACGGPVQTFGSQQVRQTVWDVRAIEQRPYPETPLYLNLTAQPEAIHRAFHYRVTQAKSKVTGTCGGVKTSWPSTTYSRQTPTSPTLDYALADAEVEQAMRLQVKDRMVNLADTIGEYRECVAMAAMPFKAMRDVVVDIREARKKSVGRRIKVGKNIYRRQATMARQLQLLPATVLISDFGLSPSIDLLDEVVTRWNARLSHPFVVRVNATRSSRAVSTLSGVKGEQIAEGVCWKRGVGYVDLKSLQDRQFTSGNIAEAVWAGIPFSFLVDRFVKVGDWLSSFDALSGADFIGGTITTRVRYVLTDTRVTAVDTAYTTYTNLHEGRGYYKSHQRTLLATLSIGRPYYSPSKGVRVLRDLVSILAMAALNRRVEALFDLAKTR